MEINLQPAVVYEEGKGGGIGLFWLKQITQVVYNRTLGKKIYSS